MTFYLIGLPDYYQQWYLWAKICVVILVTVLYFPITRYTLVRYWNDGRHLVNSCWLALYLTVPLFIYDYILLAWYKGLGIGFVVPYWYLSFFYFSFWFQFPLQDKPWDHVPFNYDFSKYFSDAALARKVILELAHVICTHFYCIQ